VTSEIPDAAKLPPLTEITEKELLDHLNEGQWRGVVLFFTPLCGTCQVAERMLSIARNAAGAAVPFFKININYSPWLREEWRIISVPCLVLIREGKPARKEYAMQGAGHLFRLVEGFIQASV
jgi:thioredoxin-like negative regulator of GroEL